MHDTYRHALRGPQLRQLRVVNGVERTRGELEFGMPPRRERSPRCRTCPGSALGDRTHARRPRTAVPRTVAEVQTRLETLPAWARHLVTQLDTERRLAIQRAQAAEHAAAVVQGREWFTLPGPDFASGESTRTLYFLARNEAVALCSVAAGDVLLVGRQLPVAADVRSR
jgi:hypothetical protein